MSWVEESKGKYFSACCFGITRRLSLPTSLGVTTFSNICSFSTVAAGSVVEEGDGSEPSVQWRTKAEEEEEGEVEETGGRNRCSTSSSSEKHLLLSFLAWLSSIYA